MQLDRLGVGFCRFGKGFDGLVRLLVQQKVQTLEVGLGQLLGLRNNVLDIDACSQPAEHEKQGKCEQPPVFELHARATPRL